MFLPPSSGNDPGLSPVIPLLASASSSGFLPLVPQLIIVTRVCFTFQSEKNLENRSVYTLHFCTFLLGL